MTERPTEAMKEAHREMLRRVCEFIEDQGEYEAKVYFDYSGRGMYGATCDGIVTDAPAILLGVAFCVIAAEDGVEPDDVYGRGMAPRRQDSMGLSTIYY